MSIELDQAFVDKLNADNKFKDEFLYFQCKKCGVISTGRPTDMASAICHEKNPWVRMSACENAIESREVEKRRLAEKD